MDKVPDIGISVITKYITLFIIEIFLTYSGATTSKVLQKWDKQLYSFCLSVTYFTKCNFCLNKFHIYDELRGILNRSF